MEFEHVQKAVHQTAVEHGWWEGGEPNIPEKLMLIVSEVSEALEEYRSGRGYQEIYAVDGPYELGDKPEGFGIELADAVIRILDLCEYLEIDLEEAIATKNYYNRTRAWRHGNKLA